MELLRISGKNLGIAAMPDFCPRCFWIQLHSNFKLPFTVFPGIFSSIDSYTKKITNFHYDRTERVPTWLSGFGNLRRPIKAPHFNKFYIVDEDTNIHLTGLIDELFEMDDGSYFIVDYKTAKFTPNQDKLLPIYETQLNAYAYIAERTGYSPVSGLGLVYYEPFTDIDMHTVNEYVADDRFSMHFTGNLHRIDLKMGIVPPLLRKVREIHDIPKVPPGRENCSNCMLIDDFARLLQ